MEYGTLIFLHVFFGLFWAGAAVATGLFILPAVLEAGPAGGAVMAGVAKRRFPLIMTGAGILVVLTGLRMFSLRFTPEWIRLPEGMVLAVGGLLAIVALIVGVTVQKPAAERLGTLAGRIAASGAPPTAAQLAEMQTYRSRLVMGGRLTAGLLIGTAALMAVHRLAALL
ncbi:MAG: hypothetical protein ABI051_17105 [Vicinamibacterales bacterium]